MNQLPDYLKFLKMDLYGNNLGENTQNWKYFAEAIKSLPYHLQSLELDLYGNNLG